MNQNSVAEVVVNQNGIACLAFQLWEKAGRPERRDLEFWLAAEKQLLAPQNPKAVNGGNVVAKPFSGPRVLTNPVQEGRTKGAALS